jgi:4,5-dihydroxyphthalate decarboxylase
MTRRNLTIATTAYMHTIPLLSNHLKTESFDYTAVAVENIDQCTMRMIKGDFDVAEMSFATFLKVMGNNPGFKALPVFARKIPQVFAFVSEDSDLKSYEDLKGKKVAVFQYWVTASIWHRWLLSNYYNIDPKDIIWCPLRNERMDNMSYPAGYQMELKYIGGSPDELLRSGEIDCFFYARKPNNFSGLRWLFPTKIEEQIGVLKDIGFIPITHVTAIKEEILHQSPEIIGELMKFFETSRKIGHEEIGHYASSYLPFADWHLNQTEVMLGADWSENGWSRNKHVVNTFYKAALKQGFIQKEYDVNTCFVPYDFKG